MSTTTYTTAYGAVLSENRAGTLHDYVCDSGWSTRFLLGAGQTTTDAFSYWPFGEAVRNTGSTATPLLFGGGLGYHLDASARIYILSRLSNPALARWLSMDPIGLLAGNLNQYIFCNNNPVLYADPIGWDPDQCIVGQLNPRQRPPISLPPISLLPPPKYPWPNPIPDPTLPPIGTPPSDNQPPFQGKQPPPPAGLPFFPWPGKGLLYPFPSDEPKFPGPPPGKSLKPNNDVGVGIIVTGPLGGGWTGAIGGFVNPRKDVKGISVSIGNNF